MPTPDAFVELVLDTPPASAIPLRLHAPVLEARLGGADRTRLLEGVDQLRLEPTPVPIEGEAVGNAPPPVALEVPGELRVLIDRLDRRVVAALPHRRVRVGMPQVYLGSGPMDFFLLVRGGF